jgi:predicted metalloprotease with PDZ domain
MNWSEHYDGALVTEVLPNSPAEQAGLSLRDVIVAWNGEPLNPLYPTSDLSDRMSRVYPQDKIRLRVKRAGQTTDLEVTAVAMLPLGQTYPDERPPSARCGASASALLSDKSDAEVLWGNTNGVIAPCRVPMIVAPYRSQH